MNRGIKDIEQNIKVELINRIQFLTHCNVNFISLEGKMIEFKKLELKINQKQKNSIENNKST